MFRNNKDSSTIGGNKNNARGTMNKIATRDDIGATVRDKIQYVNRIMKTWSADKIVHELSGPSAKNWKALAAGCLEDMYKGDLLRTVLRLLASTEILEHLQSHELYSFFSQDSTMNCMMMYFNTGHCSSANIQHALQSGIGSTEWKQSVEDLLIFTTVVSHLMTIFASFQVNPLLPTEFLENRTKAVLGFADIIDSLPASWSIVDKNLAKQLQKKVQIVLRIRNGALAALTQKSTEREEAKQRSKDSKHRSEQMRRGGVAFLNDPTRDNDFLSSPVAPLPEELLCDAPQSLPKNLVNSHMSLTRRGGSDEDDIQPNLKVHERKSTDNLAGNARPPDVRYRNVQHYLNTHFQLVREDCLAQLRRGIATLRQQISRSDQPSHEDISPIPNAADVRKAGLAVGRGSGNDRIYMYENVNVLSIDRARAGVGYVISFDVISSSRRAVDWSNTSRFMTGSLLCLSVDGTFNKQSLVIATVDKCVNVPKTINKSWMPTITIVIEQSSVLVFDPTVSYFMIESMVFFEACRPVLCALQQLGVGFTLPFADVLTGVSRVVGPPSYLTERSQVQLCTTTTRMTGGSSKFLTDLSLQRIPDGSWDMRAVFPHFAQTCGSPFWNPRETPVLPRVSCEPPLDDSQIRAIELALSKNLCLIQGPPGTGKTFVGVLIAKILLNNTSVRSKKPILFVCQTNHALDQMLEHVYEYEKNIIRVGSRSQSEVMQGLNINNRRSGACLKRGSTEYDAMTQMNANMVALRSAFVQRKVRFQAMTNGSGTVNVLLFPNSTLARLRALLNFRSPGSGVVVETLIEKSCQQTQRNAWEACRQEAIVRAIAYRDKPPYWCNDDVGFDSWKAMPSAEKAILMATYYDPFSSSIDGIVKSWKDAMPKKTKKKKPMSADGWVTVDSSAPTAGVQDDHQLPSDAISDFEEDYVDEVDRALDDDDDISEFDVNFRSTGLARDEDLVRLVVNKVDNLSRTQIISAKDQQLLNVRDIFSLDPVDRDHLLLFWMYLLGESAASDVAIFTANYARAASVDSTFRARQDASVLQSANVIGMTTNGAAKYSETLRAMNLEVIIVEEAAEVLEASIIASLTRSTKHLILIGDHLQLRPQVTEFKIGSFHGLEISLFERLIAQGLPHVTLTTQRRMHPDISSLIRPSIYQQLYDDTTVLSHPPIRGLNGHLFFLSHTVPEDGELHAWGAVQDTTAMKKGIKSGGEQLTEMSKSNMHEATLIIALVKHLLLNSYRASQIVILTMYKGQLMLIKKLAKEGSRASLTMELPSDVRITTTDNYQGEENDIVLLSLVRSNAAGQCGFVKIQNRICVALSRARDGLIVIGNIQMFADHSPLWNTIVHDVQGRGSLSTGLKFQCTEHPDLSSFCVECADDFKESPHGGCKMVCGFLMKCDHVCSLLCHPISHDQIHCYAKCKKPRPANCPHTCPLACWQECGPCAVIVSKLRVLCGHTIRMKCALVQNVNEIACSEKCGTTMLCGHKCNEKCHPLGHDHVRYKCPQPCQRTRSTCSHPCKKPCHEICGNCEELELKLLPCGHSQLAECFEDVANVACQEKCGNLLPCGHDCSQKCGAPCDVTCMAVVKKILPLCNSVPKHWVSIACSSDVDSIPCEVACEKMLSCGHRCPGSCCLCSNSSDGITTPSCSLTCNEVCQRFLDCNHICASNHSCGTECPPCNLPCDVICSHKACPFPCSVPCEPCEQPCSYRCAHALCVSTCSQPHAFMVGNVMKFGPICEKQCKFKLKCGHKCSGVCGEDCMFVCTECEPNSSRICLPCTPQQRQMQLRCGHLISREALDRLSKGPKSAGLPACPICGRTISGVFRIAPFMTAKRKELQPIQLEQQRCQLVNECLSEIKNNNAGIVLARLQSLISTGSHSFMTDLMHLMSGKASSALGRTLDALQQFDICISSTRTNDVKREALIGKASSSLGPVTSMESLQKVKSINLRTACKCLEDAIALDPVIDSIFPESNISSSLLVITRELDERARRDLARQRLEADRRMQALSAATIRREEEQQIESSTRQVEITSNSSANLKLPTKSVIEQTMPLGGSVLHDAAAHGRFLECVQLVREGSDTSQTDDFGNTPLLTAAQNGHEAAVKFLATVSPWHCINLAQKSFMDVVLRDPIRSTLSSEFVESIENGPRQNSSEEWAAAKYFDGISCVSMDKLMSLTGLAKMKSQALDLFHTVSNDMRRPEKARISTKQAMNFVFVGNPGTGKTTVARLFGEMLSDLGLREKGKFVETSGQKLLQGGASKFADLLKSATPGVLFIDEVYQLDPKNSSEGRAITDALMEACENDRTKLTVIVAGYGDDVRDKWMASNAGISSRFPYEIVFDDFNDQELRTIFLSIVRGLEWQLAKSIDNQVDIALVAARRLARSSGSKGFANARSVRVLVEQATQRASNRQKQEQVSARSTGKRLTPSHDVTLTIVDVLGAPVRKSSPMIEELLQMKGLDDVKNSVLSLLKMSEENYNSELRGEGVMSVALHRMFIGNPGTGKTSVAKIYGKILFEMGYLSNGEVVVKGASKLVGDAVGVTAKTVNDLLDSVRGKVLIIDEAYVLARPNSLYGREALDTLVERVQGGGASEDFAVILCGYEDAMMDMLRNGNDGLSSRFRSEDAFHFRDYDDEALTQIMVEVASKRQLLVPVDMAAAAVRHVLAKLRAKPKFGNVRSVDNLLDRAIAKILSRPNRSKIGGKWVVEESDLFDAPDPDTAVNALNELINIQHIRAHIVQLQKMAKSQAKLKSNDSRALLKNYLFVGPPGTGKTTVARAFGEVFYNLGLLGSSEVVDCKAKNLIGKYVGDSIALVNAKMDEARGGVLFIDEAHGLNPGNSLYAKDAVQALIANITDPKYLGKMVIIMAGYPQDMDDLMSADAGFPRRFTEKIEFFAWSSVQCGSMIPRLCEKQSILLPQSVLEHAVHRFEELSTRPGWGNAGDVITVVDKMHKSLVCRAEDTAEAAAVMTFAVQDVDCAFDEMLRQRPVANPSSLAASLAQLKLSAGLQQSLAPVQEQQNHSQKQTQSSLQQQQQTKTRNHGIDRSDDEVWASLEEALVEKGYTMYQTRQVLMSRQIPTEVVQSVADKLCVGPEEIEPVLVGQCAVLLPRVQQMIEDFEQELQVQREATAAIERADQADREALRLQEAERRRLKAGKFICGVCGRVGCPVMPIWHEEDVEM